MKKPLWIFALIISSFAFIAVAAPLTELYFAWNVPFVKIDYQNFNIYGQEIPVQQQWGYAFISAIFLMLPGRLIPLAISKIWK